MPIPIAPNILATELLEQGTTFEEVADILANAPIVRKHYAKWSRSCRSAFQTYNPRIRRYS